MTKKEYKLNPSQLEAVTTTEGPVVVIAGAGTGKTRVIERRVSYLVENRINPSAILLLTFTRKAAREMLSRAARNNPKCKHVDGGTFHSFGFNKLKRYGKAIGLPSYFSILDEGDSEDAIHRCATKLGFYNDKKRFPKKNILKKIISASVNKGLSIKKILTKEYPEYINFIPHIKTLRKKYAKYKTARHYMDYDDLLVYLKQLLENKRVREQISQQYKYIMVDEYQDTNKIQGDIVRLLGAKHKNVMVVGDDAQSIYAFRGATHKNIMEFPERFQRCKIIKLEKNYRSLQPVLNLANAVLDNMKEKYPKKLQAARDKKGKMPMLCSFTTCYDEAAWIAKKIKRLMDEDIPLSQIGVLFRSAYLSIPLQGALMERDIPFQIFGGLKFNELAHVKDLMSYLKIIVNPRDELAWHRILMLIDGIGPKASDSISEDILPCHNLDEVIASVFRKYKKYKYYNDLKKLKIVLKTINSKKLTIGEQFEALLDYYTPILQDKFDDNWRDRLKELETVIQMSAKYNSLEELLADFAIDPPDKGIADVESTEAEEELLTLSTIHSAKGLEWKNVFLIGLTDGSLPISYALKDEEQIEEERRLLYVAITRAKNNLFLSFAQESSGYGNAEFSKTSRFIDVPNVLSELKQETFHNS